MDNPSGQTSGPSTTTDVSDEEQVLSNALVIGLCGRAGAGVTFVAKALANKLRGYGYEPVIIDATKIALGKVSTSEDQNNQFKDLADKLKKLNTPEKAAEFGDELGRLLLKKMVDEGLKADARKVVILDGLVSRMETKYLKQVLGSCFWLVGVVAHTARRRTRLMSRKEVDENLLGMIEKSHVQKEVTDLIASADYFFGNDYLQETRISPEAERFLRLVFGSFIETPRIEEYGMHMARTASYSSACLSRQVGAAIISAEGRLLATGTNDVPRYGGGLYRTEHANDQRCFTSLGFCENDRRKHELAKNVAQTLMEAQLVVKEINNPAALAEVDSQGISDNADIGTNNAGACSKESPATNTNSDVQERVIKVLLEQSRLKDIIEFSRAVHAEMDAIVAVARGAVSGIVGSTMYVTTYPCHNCAKHIIDAGIRRIVYIEPYRKSLASELHSDTISEERDEQGGDECSSHLAHCSKVVHFEIYRGVSPSRYMSLFNSAEERKDKNGSMCRKKSEKPHEQKPRFAVSIKDLKQRLQIFTTESSPNSHTSVPAG